MTIKEHAQEIVRWRVQQGFITPHGIGTEEQKHQMLGKLMLVVSELAEAAEAVRHEDEENFKEELADAFIRLLDISETCAIDMEEEVKQKMNANWQRPIKNGKICSL